MLPENIELKILEYLNVKPRKRCRATNRKGKICKKNAKKGYLICEHHKKKLEQINISSGTQFIELCIMIMKVIKYNNQYNYFVNYNSWIKESCPLYQSV